MSVGVRIFLEEIANNDLCPAVSVHICAQWDVCVVRCVTCGVYEHNVHTSCYLICVHSLGK